MVRPYLYDVNILLALSWPNHVHHQLVTNWCVIAKPSGFRTCPLTQLGFLRLSTNLRFTKEAMTPGQALDRLAEITALPEHQFWPDDRPASSIDARRISGHGQWTDAYLLALAERRGGTVATLDRGLAMLAGRRSSLVELIA